MRPPLLTLAVLLLVQACAGAATQTLGVPKTPRVLTPPTSAVNPTPAAIPQGPVRVGAWTQVVPTPAAPQRYTAEPFIDGNGQHSLTIRDSQTGRPLSLGDAEGNADLETISDSYVIWRYALIDHPLAPPRQSGLYAYDLRTSSEIVIRTGAGYIGDVHQDGDWITYVDNSDTYTMSLLAVRARNLATGEDILLSQTVPDQRGHVPNGLHDVHDGLAAWSVQSPDPRQGVIGVLNLATRQSRFLKVPAVNGPYRISVSANYVVWSDSGCFGYDLSSNGLFSIPCVPPGWEGGQAIDLLAENDHLEWHLASAPPGAAYFVAAVIRN